VSHRLAAMSAAGWLSWSGSVDKASMAWRVRGGRRKPVSKLRGRGDQRLPAGEVPNLAKDGMAKFGAAAAPPTP
jgi:hypothetical protein